MDSYFENLGRTVRERQGSKTVHAGSYRKIMSGFAESLRAVFSLIICVVPEYKVLVPIVQNPEQILCRQ